MIVVFSLLTLVCIGIDTSNSDIKVFRILRSCNSKSTQNGLVRVANLDLRVGNPEVEVGNPDQHQISPIKKRQVQPAAFA